MDPSILLRSQPQQQFADPLELYGRALSLRQLMEQGQVRRQQIEAQQLAMQQTRRNMAEQERFDQNIGTLPENATLQQVVSAVGARQGLPYFQQQRQAQTAALTQDQARVSLQSAKDKQRRENLARWADDVAAIRSLPEAERPAAYTQMQQQYRDRGEEGVDYDAPLPGDPQMRALEIRARGEKAVMDREEAVREAARKAAADARAEAESRQKLLKGGFEIAGQTVGGVTNQAEYDAWRANLDPAIQSRVPEKFDPAAVSIIERQSMTPAQRATTAAQEATRAEQARHNRATEGLTARGQNMADARHERAGGDSSALAEAVIQNPTLFDNLTPTAKTAIGPELARRGFQGFGKPLSEGAIDKLAQGRSAISSLNDLREVLKTNEQYIGPVAGLQALNPYSKAREAQADIDRVRQRVGKALEGGVLRKEDEEKYKRILATLRDDPRTAIYKVDRLVQDLNRDLETFTNEQRSAGRRVESPGQQAQPAGQPSQPKATHRFNPATGQIEAIR
jgi:hypothetical protein